MAVGSGSPVIGIERAVAELGIADRFELLQSSEGLARGKPHPDVFLAVAEAFCVPPARCLVFEDSMAGARAARAAGMPAIVRPGRHADGVERLATRVVQAWDEVTVRAVFGGTG